MALNATKLANALKGSSRNTRITDEVKARINELIEQNMKVNEIFKELKEDFPGLQYQNIRSYVQREFQKAMKSAHETA